MTDKLLALLIVILLGLSGCNRTPAINNSSSQSTPTQPIKISLYTPLVFEEIKTIDGVPDMRLHVFRIADHKDTVVYRWLYVLHGSEPNETLEFECIYNSKIEREMRMLESKPKNKEKIDRIKRLQKQLIELQDSLNKP